MARQSTAKTKQARRSREEIQDDDDVMEAELPEGNFVVLEGYERVVNAYIEKGEPIERGDVINVSHAMYHRLMGQTYMHPKSDEDRPVWRDATEDEIMDWAENRSGDTPETMREADLIRLAREESVASGHANPDTEERHLREQRLVEQRDPLAAQPRRRRRRSSGADED